MKLGFSQQELITTAKSLGLPTDGFIQRRVARAFDLVESNKVSQIDDGIFRVRSQYEPNKSYIVNVNHGQPFCDCPDGERTQNCKHRIASLLFSKSFVASQVEKAVALPRLGESGCTTAFMGTGRKKPRFNLTLIISSRNLNLMTLTKSKVDGTENLLGSSETVNMS